MAKGYAPSEAILKRYADVLVNFALGGGKGIKKGDVVCIVAPEVAKPLFLAAYHAVLDAGGNAILNYHPNEHDRYGIGAEFFKRAKDHQIDHFPAKYMKGLVDEIDHLLFIMGDTDPHALKDIDPQKIMRRSRSKKPFMDWRRKKENLGKFFWSIALYGTEAMAKEAGLSPRAYWQEIINACFLDQKDPIAKWRQVYREIGAYKDKLNALSPVINKLHVEGPDADLWITLGGKRRWLSGRGANMPSFEIFTSPDWRGTEGRIRFNQPLYHYGSKVTGIELWFKDGKVYKSKAKTGQKLLAAMLKVPGADQIGEFSLTDSRHSRIKKFMADTMYDENMGGPQGNTHLALGSSYHDAFTGNLALFTPNLAKRLGFNDSSTHTDIISTIRRTVTAHLKNGKTKVIYKDGQFVL